MIFLFSECKSQEGNDIAKLILQNKYSETITFAKHDLIANPYNILDMHAIGRSYAELHNIDSSLPYLEKVIKMDQDKTWLSAWSYAYLGFDYYISHNDLKAIENLKKCTSLEATKNATQFANMLLNASLLNSYYKTWITIEKKNIIYHFQDTSLFHISEFIAVHEKAYEEINTIFEAKLSGKLELFVWKDKEIAESILGHSIGFSEPKFFISHTHYRQTLGHEMSHILSYWAWGIRPKITNRFINEGIAVCFDKTNEKTRYEYAKKVAIANNIKSILNVWQNGDHISEDVLYPLAGAFVDFLYKNSTLEQFKNIVKTQSIQNVQNVFGSAFDSLITKFNQSIGISQ